jgi:hypothetical protein
MPEHDDIDYFLYKLVKDSDWHLEKTGCCDGNPQAPSLENEILPIFTYRWATGTNQHTASYFGRIEPAPKLASRFLIEDWPLMWFYNLTFSTERPHPLLKDTTYLEQPTQFVPASMATVKKNIRDLGEVITFMHAPINPANPDYGTTHRRKSDAPSFHSFCERDWHSCPDQFDSNVKRRLHPCIVLNNYFQNYFRDHKGWDAASRTSRYRTLFLFAPTFVHEFAHTYWNWLHRHSAEPCWNKSEQVNELGFSWERQVIGRVVCPVQIRNAYGYRILYSAEIREYTNAQAYWGMEGKVRKMVNAHLTSRDARGKERTWPLLEPSGMRGSQLFMPKCCD